MNYRSSIASRTGGSCPTERRWTSAVEPSHFSLPKPMELVLRPDEHWYRLRRTSVLRPAR